MVERRKLDYFLLRYVPNAVREEFVNIALVMTESGGDGGGFAGMHFTRDWRRARRVDPYIDVEVLEALGREMERRLSDVAERAKLLHEMMDSYSNLLQLSPMRHCLAEDPARELKDLASRLVEMAKPAEEGKEREPGRRAGRKWIYSEMSAAFRSAGAWDALMKGVPVSSYTNENDDFAFDFGYAVGNEIKLFHAVSLVDIGQETRMFPLRVAKIGPRMANLRKAVPHFTAVVEDGFDPNEKAAKTVLAFMADENIRVAHLREMNGIAEEARVALGV